ncbi:T9SS type A sorting domain-containing protein [Aquiflexum sp.]|uniref:T9SS type A sorting domain-containing protein n=1 Tax=Aquiflexum sp. TaxID=1872584 RepID=UPI0035931661
MRNIISILFLYSCINTICQAQTWTGNLSSNWNTAGNWTPASVPGSGNDVFINNSSAPHQPILPTNLTIRDLFVSAGTLDLSGFDLNVRDVNLTGGTISNGSIQTSRNISEMQNMVFNGTITIIKNGGGNNNLGGGNVFNGPTTITNLNNSRLRLASSVGDTFNSTVVFNKNGTGILEIAYNGVNTFNQEITINNTSPNNQLNFGQGGGTSSLVNGVLVTSNFNTGNLTINNFSQQSTAPNGEFRPNNFTVSNSTFLGDFSVTTSGTITLSGANTFASNNEFISGGQFLISHGGNHFSNLAGTTSITRNGGGNATWGQGNSFGNFIFIDNASSNMTWEGDNTFNGPAFITNNSNNVFRMSNSVGNIFNSTVHFVNNGTSTMDIAFNGNTIFSDQITIDNNGAGNIRFGGTLTQTGTIVQSHGGINTNNLTNGTLTFRRFTQIEDSPNGPFNPLNFEVSDSTFEGDFSISAIGQITFLGGSMFRGDNSFAAAGNISITNGGNTFSDPGKTTTIIRNGGGNVTWVGGNHTGNFILVENASGNLIWQGGNTFNGNVSITNNSNNLLRLANSTGDTYLGTSEFDNNGNNTIDIGRIGTNTYAAQITINNNHAGGSINFGSNGGTNELQSGALTTTNFNRGTLNIQNFTQLSNIPNGSFRPDAFTAGNNSFEGDFTVTTSGDMNLQANNRFASNNSFISNGQLTLGGNSQFSTNTGTNSFFEKNGGGYVSWNGGNTFGTVHFVKNTANYIRMTNNGQGDNFISTSLFTNNSAGEFDIARNGTNTFGSTVTINNSGTGGFYFGRNGGSSLLLEGGLETSEFNNGVLEIRNFTQGASAPNGSFHPDTFLSNNVSFLGDLSVITSNTGINSLTFQNNSHFARNNIFISDGGIVMIGGNRFSTVSGTNTILVKNGSVHNDWQGNNTFGNIHITTNGTGRIRMSNSAPIGDNFIGNATFNRNGAGEFDPVRTGVSNFSGNISTLDSTNPITFGLNNGTVNIMGNTSQQLLGDSANLPTIRRLSMNTSGNLEVLVPFNLGVTMTLNNGIIENNENLITFIDGSTVNGGSNTSHIDGRIRKIGNAAFTYPFGNDGFYAPLTTSGFGGGGSNAFHFTGRYFRVNPDLVPYDRESKESSIGIVNECEFWEFDRTNGTSNPTVTLSWSEGRTCPIVDYSEFIFTQWNGFEWVNLGANGLSGNGSSGSVRNQTPISNWSNGIFTLGQTFRILPIELLQFSAIAINDRQIKISWSTATEKDNAFFTIMKSLDGQNWFPIGLMDGAGNSEVILSYEFIDENPVLGRQFYRLTQTDFDGKSETFNVVGVTMNYLGENFGVKVYPNPTQGKVNILAENQHFNNATISIYNPQGSLVYTLKNHSGRNTEIDLSGLNKGIYLVKIYNNHHVETKKIILK